MVATPFEVLQEIFKHGVGLFACTQVCRAWSNAAVPLLWEAPFLFQWQDNALCVRSLVACLSDDEHKELGTAVSTRRPLFSYPSFIRRLDLRYVEEGAVKYCENAGIGNSRKLY